MALIEQEDDDNHHHHQQLQQPSNAFEPSPEPSSSQSTTVPTEIIVEILFKLPVESLLRCKSVCKLWFSLISDPHFVKSHLNLSAHNNNNTRLMFSLGSTILKTCCLDDVLMDGGFINNDGLEVVDFPLKSDSKFVRVIGSCNGLLCLHIRIKKDSRDKILFIWNPSIKKYHKLPSDCYQTNCVLACFGFGYDESSDDYKVVSVYLKLKKNHKHECDMVVGIYSLRNGGWKDIGVFPHGIEYEFSGKLLNGALHWVAYDARRQHGKIISLDLATETFGEVMTPPVFDEGKLQLLLGSLGEWLCVLCHYCEDRVDLWAMKAYGVKDSWAKLVSVPYTIDPDIRYLLAPLCISNDGKILFTYADKLIIYDSNNSSFSDVQNFDEEVEASTIFESLVSPMPPAASLEHRAAGST